MTIRVKICGINDPLAFDTAIAAGADWVGFAFYPPSPRYVTPAKAAELSSRSPGGALRVGLFVNPTPQEIAATLETVRLDILQIYGAANLQGLRDCFGLPIWRPVGVSSAADLPRDAPGADRLIVEAKPPPGATRPGGNAARFDWSLLRGWNAPLPWILAGGLTPDNVAEAVRITRARAVDVSSGVETAPGVKDPALIRAFVANARAAGVSLRCGTPADAEGIAHAHVQAWRETYVGQVPDEVLAQLDPHEWAEMWRKAIAGAARVQVAEQNGMIVGFGASRPQPDPSLPFAAEISALYVLRQAQRQGIGQKIMSAIAHDLLGRNVGSVSLWVLETNAPARHFYRSLGGREVVRREEFRQGFSAIGIAYGWQDLKALL